MIRLLGNSSNKELATLNQVLRDGEHALGKLWTRQRQDPQQRPCNIAQRKGAPSNSARADIRVITFPIYAA